METQGDGKSGRRRKRGGKGRKGKQVASSASLETQSTSSRKVNPKGNSSIVNDGTNAGTSLRGQRRQTSEKSKPRGTDEESQFSTKSNMASREPASIPVGRVPSAQSSSRLNTGNSGKAVDLLQQSRPAEKTKQQKLPLSSSDEFLSEIVCQLATNGGSLPVKTFRKSHGHLYDSMIKLSPDKTVRGFVQKYSHVLKGRPDTGTIDVLTFTPDLEICKAHGSNAGSCTVVDCRCLHICKFQMMSQCSMGETCFFGHNLRNTYNKSVLEYYFMNKLSKQQIRGFLCKMNNRRGLTLPGICSFYNSQKGCRKPDKCPFLHICKHYILGDCQFARRKCSFSHEIFDKQPQSILSKYSLSETTFEELQRVLKAELQGTEYSSSSDEHYTGDSSYDDQNSDVSSNEPADVEEIFENESDVRDDMKTVNNGLRCLPAWSSDSESRHLPLEGGQQPKVSSSEHVELMSPPITSSTEDGDIDSRVTRSLPSSNPRWQVSTATDRKTIELGASDRQELEFLYHTYLRARECTVSLNGKK
ncbi:zinc finger CCCH domain-containing protein 6-like [Pecten maximus]|uniref:zinc finger CCCH domain-containing protein 6-like n=1 Tax=Pecten maximus TaxID=6579 RepID=UPI0014590A19|nr:zinc finger CCCH domain-containing protein 6-like [Pecten maximus]